jgi:hypothetical protein
MSNDCEGPLIASLLNHSNGCGKFFTSDNNSGQSVLGLETK